MATFSDLVTLLLTFFVMLMAMASFEDAEDLDVVLESIRRALAELGMGDGLVSMVLGEDEMSDNIRKDRTVRPDRARDREAQEADESDAVVRVSPVETEVRLTLDEQIFFATGASELRPGARERLGELGLVLRGHDVGIRVEGHADGVGLESANWALSLERALVVTDILHEDARIPLDRLDARGLGAFHPEVVREADQARNRRIDLVLTGSDAETAEALGAVRRLEDEDE